MTDLLSWGLVLFVLCLPAGFWLLKIGKPYQTGIINLHKLIALGSAVLMLYSLYMRSREGDSLVPLITFFIGGIMLVILSFASGALISIGKPAPRAMTIAHRISAGLACVAMAYILYLRINGLI